MERRLRWRNEPRFPCMCLSGRQTPMKYTPRLSENNVNVTPTSPLREFFVLAGGLLGIVVGGYLLLGLAVDWVAPRISPKLENKMGTLFVRSFVQQGPVPKAAGAVQNLVDDLQDRCARLPYTFHILVIDNPAVNAAALPGGHILVFTGLLEKVTSENELAFVLAHELGHYAHRDHLRGMGRALVVMAAGTLLFGPDSSVGSLLGNALNVTALNFSRTQEARADTFAVDTLQCAYGHVGGATDFFEKIGRAKDPGRFGHYFATHPENRRRIAHVKAYAGARGYRWGPTIPMTEIPARPKVEPE